MESAWYDKISSFENLYNAHRKTRLGKRTKREVIEFEMDLSKNIMDLKEALATRTWQPSGYYEFEVYEPKLRTIYAPHYSDRVVQRCLCDNIIKPILDKRLIYDNAACRENKGTHFALRRLGKFMVEHYKQHGNSGHCLKIDIAKYFYNIDHNVLKDKLRGVFDNGVLDILCKIIDSHNGNTAKGLPLGNQTSQWMALWYLDSVDRLIKERMQIKHYTRYMDDFVLIHESKEYLQQCLVDIQQALTHIGLATNSKTQILPLSQGVLYLGWRNIVTKSGKIIRFIATGTKIRLKRCIKRLVDDYRNESIGLDYIKPRINSYIAHLSHGHTWRLRSKIMSKSVFKIENK